MTSALQQATKSSGVAWIGEVPEDWDVARLSFRYNQQLGKMLNQAAAEGPNQAPYLANKDVQWGRVEVDDLSTMHFSPAERVKFGLEFGDLLVCEGGEVGRTAIWRNEIDPCFFQKAIHRLRPVDRSRDEPRFFFYCMVAATLGRVFEEEGSKSTISHLTGEALRAHRFPFPPLPTQKAIADFLDHKTATIDALIEKKRRLLDLLAEKRSALINRAVTKGLDPDVAMKDSGVPWIGKIPAHWDVKRLKFVSEFVTSGPRGWSQYYAEEGAVFLRIGNVSRDDIDLLLDDIQRVQPPPSSEGTRTLIMPDDLLITITADIGSVGVVPAGLGEAYVNQHTALVRIDPKAADARFVAYAAKSPWGRLHFDESMQGGTKVGLNLDDVRNMSFGTPSLSEQERIARHLDDYCDATARVAHQIQRQIEKLQEYRQALITAAVTGKVDVTGAGVR